MQENRKDWGPLQLRSLGMAGVADPKDTRPSPRVTTSDLVVL